MKNFIFIALASMLLFSLACNNTGSEDKIPDAIEEPKDSVISVENVKPKNVNIEVYNFYANKRSKESVAIGENAKSTLSENFKAEMEVGKVKYIELNFEESTNQELVAKFEVKNPGLFILSKIDGEEIIENLTEFA